jgi:hypothetical protein
LRDEYSIYETYLLVNNTLARVKSIIPPKYEGEDSMIIIDDNAERDSILKL